MQNKIGEVRLVSSKGKQIAKRVIYMTCRDRGASLAITFSFKRRATGNDTFNPQSLAKKLRRTFEWVTVRKTAIEYRWNGSHLRTKFSIHFSSETLEDINRKMNELNGMKIPIRQYNPKHDTMTYFNLEITKLDVDLRDVYKGWVIDKL